MPVASHSYEVQLTVLAGDAVSVTITVLDAVNLERELFVYDAEHSTYSHFASLHDLLTYPTLRDPLQLWYRSATVTKHFTTVADAQCFIALARGRLERVRRDWQDYVTQADTHYVITMPDPY